MMIFAPPGNYMGVPGLSGMGDDCSYDFVSGQYLDSSGNPCAPGGTTSVAPTNVTTITCPAGQYELADGSGCGTPTPVSTPVASSGSTTCYAYGSNGSCLSYTPDGGATIIGCGTSNVPPCNQSGTPNTINAVSPNSNALTNFLNSLAKSTPTILSAITGQPITQAQCTASNGTWNASTNVCTPGMGTYTPLILVALGIGAVLLLTSKGGR